MKAIAGFIDFILNNNGKSLGEVSGEIVLENVIFSQRINFVLYIK